jgi:putative zinc finger protein
MEHSEAVKLHAVEAYLLGELTTSQRDAFEEHYFGCADCAAEVKAAAVFLDNAREAMRRAPETEAAPAPERRQRRDWFAWLRPAYAAGAIAVLVLAIGYQNLVTIPRLQGRIGGNLAQALPTFNLAASGSRGAEDATEIAVRHTSPFGIYVDIPGNPRFVSYSCEIQTQEGIRKLRMDVSPAQAKDAVELFIPGGSLDAGRYEVVVVGNPAEGARSEQLVRHPFVVKDLP